MEYSRSKSRRRSTRSKTIVIDRSILRAAEEIETNKIVNVSASKSEDSCPGVISGFRGYQNVKNSRSRSDSNVFNGINPQIISENSIRGAQERIILNESAINDSVNIGLTKKNSLRIERTFDFTELRNAFINIENISNFKRISESVSEINDILKRFKLDDNRSLEVQVPSPKPEDLCPKLKDNPFIQQDKARKKD